MHIALCLRTGALTVEYFRAYGFYEWLAIFTGSYWSSEESNNLLGNLGRNKCKLSMSTPKCVRKSYILLHFTNSHVYQCPRLRAYIHARFDQSISIHHSCCTFSRSRQLDLCICTRQRVPIITQCVSALGRFAPNYALHSRKFVNQILFHYENFSIGNLH